MNGAESLILFILYRTSTPPQGNIFHPHASFVFLRCPLCKFSFTQVAYLCSIPSISLYVGYLIITYTQDI